MIKLKIYFTLRQMLYNLRLDWNIILTSFNKSIGTRSYISYLNSIIRYFIYIMIEMLDQIDSESSSCEVNFL